MIAGRAAFHDQFLSYGGPPIPLVRQQMLGGPAEHPAEPCIYSPKRILNRAPYMRGSPTVAVSKPRPPISPLIPV